MKNRIIIIYILLSYGITCLFWLSLLINREPIDLITASDDAAQVMAMVCSML